MRPNGQLIRSSGPAIGPRLPVTAATRAVAAGKRGAFLSDATAGGTHVRVLTERVPSGGVLQVAFPLTGWGQTPQQGAQNVQQTIQQALRDVSDALIAYRKGREFREQQELLARSATSPPPLPVRL